MTELRVAMLLTLLACFRSPVAAVPDNAVKIAVTASKVTVEGSAVGPFALLEADPVDDDVPAVREVLEGFAGRPGWIELPGDAQFFVARKVVNAARRAGLDPLVLSVVGGERAYELSKAPTYALSGPCPDGPRAVTGTQPLVTVWIQTDREGTWLLGEARHLPLVAGPDGQAAPTDFIPASCLQAPDCTTVYGTTARRGFCEGDGGPQEVRLGGDVSACLVPIAKEASDTRRWAPELAKHVRRLGLAHQPLTKIVPEGRTPVAALTATLEGFRLADAPAPAVATRLLVEGNDGPLDCIAPAAVVQSASELADSGARYLGSIERPSPPVISEPSEP